MQIKTASWLAILFLLSPLLCAAQSNYPNTGNFGVEADRSAPWYQQCLAARSATPSTAPSEMAMQYQRKAGDCDATAAYYDKLDQAATSDAEWSGVRRCALSVNDTAVLAMLYANGLGVPRDTRTAIHYACRTGAAAAEMESRVMHLASLAPGRRYDQCDDITSGLMGGVCSAIASSRAERVETAFYKRLRGTMTAPQRQAFERLVKAGAAWANTHGNYEIARGGTAYISMVVDAEATEREWLREHLTAFEKGRFDAPPPAQFSQDDAELNRVYGTLMLKPLSEDLTEVSAADIRKTQRAWLAYRDAWVAFAALRYPALPADALKALLTQWRVKLLSQL